ncbi:MAG: hypothetical protein K8U03_05535 [Planctomycetia bacterium]|nr:hypothetical protein [Planctomycetia bacterium]
MIDDALYFAPTFGAEAHLRVWKDSQATFEVSAEFVRRIGSRVILRRTDGVDLEVGIERLSAADQDFVRALSKSTKASLPSPNAADSHIVVELSSQLRSNTIVRGTVFAEDTRNRYVAADTSFGDSLVTYFGSSTGQAHALIESAGVTRRVPLEKISFDEGSKLVLLAAPKAELPPPFDPVGVPTFRRGDGLLFSGYEIRIENKKAVVERIVMEAFVREQYRDLQGTPQGFLADLAQRTHVTHGVLVTHDGTAIGPAYASRIVESNGPESTPRMDRKYTFDSLRQTSMQSLRKLMVPQVLAVRNRVTYGLDSAEVIMSLQLVQFPALPISDKLRLLAVEVERMNPTLAQITLQDGTWINRPAKGALEIDLRPATPADSQVASSLSLGDWPHLQTWTGKFPTPIDIRTRQFFCRCVYVDAEGKYQPLGAQQPFSFWTSSDELARVRFENRLQLAKHPRGGLIVTGKESIVDHPPGNAVTLKRENPIDVEKPLGTKLERAPALSWMRLDEKLAPVKGFQAHRVTASRDGKWAYVVDGKHVLHKIDSAVWVDRRTIALPSECRDLGYCEKGLCVLFERIGIVWILDPETLDLKFELAVPNAMYLAVGAQSTRGYAIGRDLMVLFDVEHGVLRHRIHGDRLRLGVGAFSNDFRLGEGGMTLSDDGKRLVLDLNTAPLYRIDGDDVL